MDVKVVSYGNLAVLEWWGDEPDPESCVFLERRVQHVWLGMRKGVKKARKKAVGEFSNRYKERHVTRRLHRISVTGAQDGKKLLTRV